MSGVSISQATEHPSETPNYDSIWARYKLRRSKFAINALFNGDLNSAIYPLGPWGKHEVTVHPETPSRDVVEHYKNTLRAIIATDLRTLGLDLPCLDANGSEEDEDWDEDPEDAQIMVHDPIEQARHQEVLAEMNEVRNFLTRVLPSFETTEMEYLSALSEMYQSLQRRLANLGEPSSEVLGQYEDLASALWLMPIEFGETIELLGLDFSVPALYEELDQFGSSDVHQGVNDIASRDWSEGFVGIMNNWKVAVQAHLERSLEIVAQAKIDHLNPFS